MEGFEPIRILKGASTISVTSNGLNFNYNVIARLHNPSYILLLLNKELKMIAVKECDKNDDNAIAFTYGRNNIKNGIRFHNKDIEQLLENLMGWRLEEANYKIDGVYNMEENAMIFDLKKARSFGKKNFDKK